MQDREPEGRRDDRVLYTAITNPEVLQPWLEAIDRLQVPLGGIHSAAAFSARLLETLELEFPHTLLVTFTPGGAIRQTYFRDKSIRFSRLTPVDLEEGEDLGAVTTEETTRTWQYLDSLRNFGESDLLEVIVLAHPKDRGSLEPHLRDFGQIRYRLLDIEQVAGRIGLKPPPLGSSAESVLVQLFLKRAAPNDFAVPEMRRHAILRSARVTLNAVSAVILAVGFVWGMFALAKIVQAEAADFARERDLAAVRNETQRIRKSLPAEGMGGTAMREAVAFYNTSIRDHPSPIRFLVPVTKVLEAHPRIRVLQFTWQTSSDPKAAPPLTPSATRDTVPVRALKRTGEPAPAAPADSSETPFSERRHAVSLLEGMVRVPNGDYRGAVTEVETLAAAIGAIPGYTAEVVDSPLDTRPSLAVQGRVLERDPDNVEARFVLRISRQVRAAS